VPRSLCGHLIEPRGVDLEAGRRGKTLVDRVEDGATGSARPVRSTIRARVRGAATTRTPRSGRFGLGRSGELPSADHRLVAAVCIAAISAHQHLQPEAEATRSWPRR
jgi:hypothetical protein